MASRLILRRVFLAKTRRNGRQHRLKWTAQSDQSPQGHAWTLTSVPQLNMPRSGHTPATSDREEHAKEKMR